MIINALAEFVDHIQNRHLRCVDITYDNWTDRKIQLRLGYSQEERAKFLEFLNFNYDNGFGHQYIYGTIWYMDGTWSTRKEYDGQESWQHNTLPEIPAELQ